MFNRVRTCLALGTVDPTPAPARAPCLLDPGPHRPKAGPSARIHRMIKSCRCRSRKLSNISLLCFSFCLVCGCGVASRRIPGPIHGRGFCGQGRWKFVQEGLRRGGLKDGGGAVDHCPHGRVDLSTTCTAYQGPYQGPLKAHENPATPVDSPSSSTIEAALKFLTVVFCPEHESKCCQRIQGISRIPMPRPHRRHPAAVGSCPHAPSGSMGVDVRF